MTGAEALLQALGNCDVDVCFANPGTSEMHFVAALDRVPAMHGVLTLFEGVATGAADGYARVASKPAATLLHLGPGLGNGLANLHNARRAHTPVVNIVGDHATYHKRFDAPLESDIESIARSVSGWYRMCQRDVQTDVNDAVRASFGPPGCVATLVLPANISWNEVEPGTNAQRSHKAPFKKAPSWVPSSHIEEIGKIFVKGGPTALLIGGDGVRERGLLAASKIAKATGAKLLGETFPATLTRGAGLPALERLGYLSEFMEMQLAGVKHLVIAGTGAPVSFFAYPTKPSYLVPDGCEVHYLADVADDVGQALSDLAEALSAKDPELVTFDRLPAPRGEISMETFAQAIGASLPEGAIVVDESNTGGLFVPGATAGCPRHQWLTLTGGAIGYGLPAATGAGVAAQRGSDGTKRVICLQADGSAMYTIQALWTQVRENLNVTTVILANRSYGILNLELSRVGADAGGPLAKKMLDISDPTIDFVSLAKGLGVPATRANTAEELVGQFANAVAEPGPNLIEAVLPTL